MLNTAPSSLVSSMSSTLESSTPPFVRAFLAVTRRVSVWLFLIVNSIGVLFKS